MLPYQWDALNDRVEGAAPSYCMRNFKTAGKKNLERKRDGGCVSGAVLHLPRF